ncbi:UDP-N-acetylmuramyl pentapeptide phosphotransferase/UDP-N-acetylglucosamine-1-phosphate transferase [Thermocatellispora tengchongensis]|uniref:UDP-N-acetylmuramyl pentapeptide phosphotransferase/UDP-N-acetylglucosamine-1-phosphate transferase n=1 Tax=Thermocatellispora tengchongensis TaxID=1073253 RepID=A0A840PC58_9ACTN|nr:hypothetical protein [Thermocatellispora tengchongensis]MBB5133605.1 UDP-N-acetylmuramyl pentapeptide phosphotransferase/UDP-N-acetylglucosamine-1-phosphate transferase [Thermocatellispora tengchongensis]
MIIDFDALWKVLVAGLAAGAGLVAVYALGLVALAARAAPGPRHAATALAVACFAIVGAGAACGLYVILAG